MRILRFGGMVTSRRGATEVFVRGLGLPSPHGGTGSTAASLIGPLVMKIYTDPACHTRGRRWERSTGWRWLIEGNEWWDRP
jgi:hypothetical protein